MNKLVVIITTQLHLIKPELRFCGGSTRVCSVSEIRNGEDLWHWSRLEIRQNVVLRSTIPQKQFIKVCFTSKVLYEGSISRQNFIKMLLIYKKTGLNSGIFIFNLWYCFSFNEKGTYLLSKEISRVDHCGATVDF